MDSVQQCLFSIALNQMYCSCCYCPAPLTYFSRYFEANKSFGTVSVRPEMLQMGPGNFFNFFETPISASNKIKMEQTNKRRRRKTSLKQFGPNILFFVWNRRLLAPKPLSQREDNKIRNNKSISEYNRTKLTQLIL